MGRFLVDDEFFRHPKAVAVGPFGRDLFLAGLAYCNRLFTDGYIPGEVAPTLAPGLPAPRKVVARLLSAGLWEEAKQGFKVHDFLDWNPTAKHRKEKLDHDRERKRLANLARNSARNPNGFHPDSARIPEGAVPVPVSENQEESTPRCVAPPPAVPVAAVSNSAERWSEQPWPSPYQLGAMYNALTPDACPHLDRMGGRRYDRARTYIRRFPEQEFWAKAFRRVKHSSFLSGKVPAREKSSKAFVASFDWFLQTHSKSGVENVIRVTEGRYDDGA